MTTPLLIRFAAGTEGAWRVDRMATLRGAPLPAAARLAVIEEAATAPPPGVRWVLAGTTSHVRYATRQEVAQLRARQAGLGRSGADRAALIPIRKSPEWWALAQDERRTLFETRSGHIAIGLDYLPAIARRLHHSRDLGEPFDFLTWFDFAAADEPAFDHMLARLRATPEWAFVDREIDIRLSRDWG